MSDFFVYYGSWFTNCSKILQLKYINAEKKKNYVWSVVRLVLYMINT